MLFFLFSESLALNTAIPGSSIKHQHQNTTRKEQNEPVLSRTHLPSNQLLT